MISRSLILLFPFVLPLAAQTAAPHLLSGPPVHVLVQADPPPLGTPPLDTARVIKPMQVFVKEHGFTRPSATGEGWILGVRLKTLEEPDGLLVAEGALRLSRLEGGRLQSEGSKDSDALVVAWKGGALEDALGDELVRRGRELLYGLQVIPSDPETAKVLFKPAPPKPGEKVLVLDISQVKILSLPVQPPYPRKARSERVQGTVVVELNVGTDGKPESAATVEGPGPLLAYSADWAMRWKFVPAEMNGKPFKSRFRLSLNFKLM